MRYGFYGSLCLFVIIVQSVAAPAPLPLHGLYDVLLPFLVYLAIFRPMGEAMTLSLLAGVVMDSVSGGAFGLYLLLYLWMTAGIRIAMRYLHGEGFPFVFSAVLAGVLLENVFFIAAGRVSGHLYAFGASSLGGLVRQLVLAGMTGPFLVFGLNAVSRRLDARFDHET